MPAVLRALSPCLLRLRVSLRSSLLALLTAALFTAPLPAQDREPTTLRLGGVMPAGVRSTTTESWTRFEFTVTNLTDTDRQARVLAFYEGQPDVQYGRDVWVPAHATLASWFLVGPAEAQAPGMARQMQMLLYDRTGGQERLVLPPTEERVRSRGVPHLKRGPFTVLLADLAPSEDDPSGRLPAPESLPDEAVGFARTFRLARGLTGQLLVLSAGKLPEVPEAFDGIDHLILASRRLADDPTGLQALRRWLENGGRVWVRLDMVDPDALAPLLGDALDFHVVDRVSLTSFRLASTAPGLNPLAQEPVQQHERPVELVRVLLPPQERPRHTVDGWPAWFTRPVGRGLVVFSTLGARGWFRERRPPPADPLSPFEAFPSLPVPHMALEVLSEEVHPNAVEETVKRDAFRPMLSEEIGYSVLSLGTVGLVFGAFLAATLALALVLRKARRPELLGWLSPVVALLVAGLLVALGARSHRAAPTTLAVAQVVQGVPGTDEAAVRGLLAFYRPDSGPVEVGTREGGHFELDMSGLEGQTRRFIMTDAPAWHWENLSLPTGVRWASFQQVLATGQPLTATARLGPDGLDGRLVTGPFGAVEDAILVPVAGRNLGLRVGPDGHFQAGSGDILATGQYLADTVLSDRQQRRQELLRSAFKRPEFGRTGTATETVLAWANPVDLGFDFGPIERRAGVALLALPLRLERPAPGARVTIPAPLIPYRRIENNAPTRPLMESRQNTDMHLRFQLPPAALPLEVEKARLVLKVDAPGREVKVSGRDGDQTTALHQVTSPLDPVRVEITDPRWLRLDPEGGLHLSVAISDPTNENAPGRRVSQVEEKWTIEYLELDVTGRAGEAGK